MIRRLGLLVLALALGIAGEARAQQVGTLSLDGLSFISFEGRQNLAIPSGSTVTFHFGAPQADGSVSFSVAPGDVSISDIPLSRTGGTLRYGLASSTRGTARTTAQGVEMSFPAVVQVTLSGGSDQGTASYPVTFTTETASAQSADGLRTERIDGMRMVTGPNHVQLVGGATNRTDAVSDPGTAVYTVLSGTFDSFPTLK